eukprot:213436_1
MSAATWLHKGKKKKALKKRTLKQIQRENGMSTGLKNSLPSEINQPKPSKRIKLDDIADHDVIDNGCASIINYNMPLLPTLPNINAETDASYNYDINSNTGFVLPVIDIHSECIQKLDVLQQELKQVKLKHKKLLFEYNKKKSSNERMEKKMEKQQKQIESLTIDNQNLLQRVGQYKKKNSEWQAVDFKVKESIMKHKDKNKLKAVNVQINSYLSIPHISRWYQGKDVSFHQQEIEAVIDYKCFQNLDKKKKIIAALITKHRMEIICLGGLNTAKLKLSMTMHRSQLRELRKTCNELLGFEFIAPEREVNRILEPGHVDKGAIKKMNLRVKKKNYSKAEIKMEETPVLKQLESTSIAKIINTHIANRKHLCSFDPEYIWSHLGSDKCNLYFQETVCVKAGKKSNSPKNSIITTLCKANVEDKYLNLKTLTNAEEINALLKHPVVIIVVTKHDAHFSWGTTVLSFGQEAQKRCDAKYVKFTQTEMRKLAKLSKNGKANRYDIDKKIWDQKHHHVNCNKSQQTLQALNITHILSNDIQMKNVFDKNKNTD